MKRTLWAGVGLETVMLVAAAAPSVAQHIGAGPTGTTPDAVLECAACHGTHEPSQGLATLRLDYADLRVAWSVAPGLGDASLSCLRCHATAREREAARPVDGAPALLIMEGRYLGLDLSDDHPMGDLEADRQLTFDDRILTLRSRRVRRDVRTLRARSRIATIECTSCHDPHSRTGLTPPPGEEAMLCADCHDAGTYALGMHSSVACSDCHALHGARGDALLSEHEENRLCESCHGRGATFAPTTRDNRRLRLLISPKGHAISPGGRCLDCHPAH